MKRRGVCEEGAIMPGLIFTTSARRLPKGLLLLLLAGLSALLLGGISVLGLGHGAGAALSAAPGVAPVGGKASGPYQGTATPTPSCPPTWHEVSGANVETDYSELWSTAAVTGNDIWAVGRYQDGYLLPPLIEHWNG